MIGTGYVGLVSGTCFSELGHTVFCVDNDSQKIAKLQMGHIPIYEPDLENLVRSNAEKDRLIFLTDLAKAVKESSVIFITVGTPNCPTTGRADLTYIESAIKEIAPLIMDYKTIVIKSTVPVGTARRLKTLVLSVNPHANFDVVSNPEFLREGHAVYDFMHPDRIIMGFCSENSRLMMDQIYNTFILKKTPVVRTSLESAEIIKYTANCFLATKIAFMNEVANLCEKLNGDIEKVREGLGLDPRIGSDYLKPGPGFGGSCFPKDMQALVSLAHECGAPQSIIEAAVRSNEKRQLEMVNKIVIACGGKVQGKKIAILGLSFKANTDDMRYSPAIPIVQGLQALNADIIAYDPAAMAIAKVVLPELVLAEDMLIAVQDADAIVIVTEWPLFKTLDFGKLKSKVVIIDLRNLYHFDEMIAKGIQYYCIGRESEFKENTIERVQKICVD